MQGRFPNSSKPDSMSPSAIVLNVCAAFFLALFLIFFSFLLVRYKNSRRQELVNEEAKEVPMYGNETTPAIQHRAKLQLAEAE